MCWRSGWGDNTERREEGKSLGKVRGGVTEPWWMDLARTAGSLGTFGIWTSQLLYQPTLGSAVAGGLRLTVAAAAVLGAGAYVLRRPPPQQTHEDLATGIWVSGYPGCGKTYLLYALMGAWAAAGYGGLWASPKGAGVEVLGRFPKEAVGRVDLLQPYGPCPRGLNILQTYQGTAAEREILAGLVTEWFVREHSAASQNMAHLLFVAALGLLEWAAAEGEQVTPVELYLMLHRPAFQRQVLARCSPVVSDILGSAKEDTLDRVRRLVSRAVASESLMVTIGQRHGINLLETMEQDRWLVLDAPYKHVPHGAFLCRTLASLVQLLTPARKPLHRGSKPFMAVFDEVQEYPIRSMARGIAMGREYGVGWCLLHHSRSGQLERENPLRAAVGLCGSKYWFRQTWEDAQDAAKASGGRWEPDTFVNLPKRSYKALRRVGGGYVQAVEGYTPDVGPPDLGVVEAIRQRNAEGPGRDEILADVYRRLRQGRGGW